ncbi:hypothetical protein C5B91_02220 [Haloferax sp. Atlit-10N]|uniref:DUF7310 domain-containing protein n=1 Tax=Haloferax prahovense (strain DSM 18310 / JCM 13924 / TL6) TaxID=1227461 RepID=M0GQE2_HALPT|nr:MULTISPECIES: hypothetical protein [Haloferax]ELZ73079.1 hypothetical protein C457_03931 [Haloferax prahovense DSM 18310]RDZ43595.1 hypothetical protein C5B86_11165 [Haloferax sp. Atlit-19N]RDZ46507.1 hypothetical protein C5B87_02220 [Haloferax sp. Atlit-16N]RDZ60340.1 hypothetical protein C5B91_02220 [Haloferax sp. Atlit-10N]
MTADSVHFDADGDTDTGTPASREPVAVDHTSDRTADLAARLDAVERTITDGDADFSSLEDLASVERRVSELESAVGSLTERLDEMDAATQAMRGYLGGVRAVNEDVERRANAALAKAESLEADLVDETASPAPSQSADTLAAEAASHAERPADGRGGTSRRKSGTRATDSRNDAAGRGLAARLRDAL